MTIPIALRRAAVMLMVGAYLAGTILQWEQHEIARQPQANIILALFALSFAIGALLFAGTHYGRWGITKNKALDEREIATRNKVYAGAYQVMAWISAALLIWWQFAQPRPLGVDANVVFWGYVLLISTLPASLLAWNDRPVK